MNQAYFYKYSTWVLLILNIGLVLFSVLRPPHHGLRFFTGSTINRLNLDQKQDEAFLQSANQHKEIVKSVNSEQSELLRQYFSLLTEDDNTVNAEVLLDKIKGLENQKIVSTYEHLNEVKMLLREDQLADFDGFVERIIRVITSEGDRPPPPQ